MIGQAVDLPQAAQEASVDPVAVVGWGLGTEDLIGRGGEDLGEADQQRSMETQVAALVLRDERGVDVEALGDLDLAEPRRFRISCSRRPNALSSGMATTFGAAATFFFMAAVYGGTGNHY